MNKENPKKNKKSFEYYIAQRKEEFRCQYDHERSWETCNISFKKKESPSQFILCCSFGSFSFSYFRSQSHILSSQ